MTTQTTRNKILKAAIEEFQKNGYRSASMRNIAKRCNMTTGAIYGVFSGKDEVYNTIVEEGVNLFLEAIRNEDDELIDMGNEKISDNIRRRAKNTTNNLLRVYLENQQALEIAFFKSERTKYSNFLDEVIEIFRLRNVRFYEQVIGEPDRTTELLIKNLTESYVMNILNVSGENFSVKEWITYTDTLIEFYICGWIGVFEKKN